VNFELLAASASPPSPLLLTHPPTWAVDEKELTHEEMLTKAREFVQDVRTVISPRDLFLFRHLLHNYKVVQRLEVLFEGLFRLFGTTESLRPFLLRFSSFVPKHAGIDWTSSIAVRSRCPRLKQCHSRLLTLEALVALVVVHCGCPLRPSVGTCVATSAGWNGSRRC